MNIVLAIFLGGGLGSVARYALGQWVLQLSPSRFPWGTLSANLLACATMGLVWLFFGKEFQRHPGWMAFAIIGFCGGFSTFSTFSFETLRLLRDGMILWAVLNVVVSVVACLLVLHLFMKSQ